MKKLLSYLKNAFAVASASLIFNIAYGTVNFAYGLRQTSFWFITTGAYHIILAVMRFCVVRIEKEQTNGSFILKFTGSMLLALDVALIGTIILSDRTDVAVAHHEIIMIAVALFAFTKITLAIIGAVKAKKINRPTLTALRNISCCDAAASILSLQRSMLVSFDGMAETHIRLMNLFTGIGVCTVVLILGISMIYKPTKRS